MASHVLKNHPASSNHKETPVKLIKPPNILFENLILMSKGVQKYLSTLLIMKIFM
jgi:hypothetical protein